MEQITFKRSVGHYSLDNDLTEFLNIKKIVLKIMEKNASHQTINRLIKLFLGRRVQLRS